MRDLAPLLSPRSVAVVGASSNLDSVAGRPIRHLLASGVDLAIYPVNPRREEIGGLRCYPDVESLPEAPDVALILTPAGSVAPTLEALGRRGTGAAIVISAGFAETGGEGVDTQRRLAAIAAASNMVLVGPNTLGVHDYVRGLPLSFVWYGRRASSPTGAVAVVTQSGSGMTSLCDRLLDLDLPLGYGVATGNEADLSVTDVVEYLAEQPDVRVIVAAFEEIRDGARFLRACRRLHELGKPLVAFKFGRTPGGSALAKSHTGALAGPYATLRALLRQHAVLEVDELDDIGPTVAAALPGRFPASRRFAVVTSSGGAAVLCADRADEVGLELPAFSPAATERIRTYLPAFSSGEVHNPLDITAQAIENRLAAAEIVSVALEEEQIDAVIQGAPSGGQSPELIQRMIEIAGASPKPVLGFILSGEEGAAQRQRLRDGGIPVFVSAGKAVEALERLSRFSVPPRPEVSSTGPAAHIALPAEGSEFATLSWLAEHGISTVPQRRAHTAAEAVAAARELGLPVAVKINSADIAHKTEVGGVRLGLSDAAAVGDAFEAVTAAAREALPGARLDGVTVSAMVPASTELILGITRDQNFGLIFALGLGGVWAEVLKDVALRGLPLVCADVPEMLAELRGAALLRGSRGSTPVDLDELSRLVVALSDLALGCGPSLEAIDLNPVVVTADGTLRVLDASVFVSPQAASPPPALSGVVS